MNNINLDILNKLIQFKIGENGKGEYSYNYENILSIPEFSSLKECQQNQRWHSEGNVWEHTLLVTNEAINMTNKDNNSLSDIDKYIFLAGALFHDIGKGCTTKINGKGNWCSYNHDNEGEKITRRLLWDVELSVRERICLLVKYHMKPLKVWESKNYLNDILEIVSSGVDINLLCDLKKCDILGSIRDNNSVTEQNNEIEIVDRFEKYSNALLPISFDIWENGTVINKLSNKSYKQAIMMIGLPGSGKDTFIEKHILSDADKGYVMISKDEIRVQLGFCKSGEKYLGTKEEEHKVTIEFNKQLKKALEDNKIPIINNINLKKSRREELKAVVGNNVKWLYIYIQPDTLKENKDRRKGQISNEVFERMISSLDFPQLDECDYLSIIKPSNDKFVEYDYQFGMSWHSFCMCN